MGIEAARPLKYLPRGHGRWCRGVSRAGRRAADGSKERRWARSPCGQAVARADESGRAECQAGEVPSQMEVSEGCACSAGKQETSGCPGETVLLVGGKGAGSLCGESPWCSAQAVLL